MTRVLQVNKLYAPWIGGIETVVQNIAEGMQAFPEVRCDVMVCCNHGFSETSDLNGIRVNRVASLGMALSMPVAPSFPLRLASAAPQYDIVHVHTPFPLVYFCDWGAVRAKGTHLVIHYHCDIVQKLQRAVLSRLKGLERRFFDAADRIIVTSEGVLNSSRVLAPYRHKCRIIPLSIDLSAVRRLNAQERYLARLRYGVNVDDRVVLFAGRLVYYKGIEVLLDAVRDLDVRVLIAGDGPMLPILRQKIEDPGLQDRVKLLGKVSDGELSELYSLSDVFVLPSTHPAEAFGVVQLEAMAHGLPVVNTNLLSGVPFVSLHEETGLTVPPGDSSALRDAIARIISDDCLRNRLSVNALRRVELFSSHAVLDKIRSLYKEISADS